MSHLKGLKSYLVTKPKQIATDPKLWNNFNCAKLGWWRIFRLSRKNKLKINFLIVTSFLWHCSKIYKTQIVTGFCEKITWQLKKFVRCTKHKPESHPGRRKCPYIQPTPTIHADRRTSLSNLQLTEVNQQPV